MKNENIINSLGIICKLFDGDTITDFRRGEKENINIEGVLTLALSGQQEISKNIINSELWRQQGILNRFLVCEPKMECVERKITDKKPLEETQKYKEYADIIKRIYHCNNNYIVHTNKDAEIFLNNYFNRKNKQAHKDEKNGGYLSRTTEIAGRIACLLAIYRHYSTVPFNNNEELVITLEDVQNATEIVDYHLYEYKRLTNGLMGQDVYKIALELFEEITSDTKKWQPKEKGVIYGNERRQYLDRHKSDSFKLKQQAFQLLIEHNYLISKEYKDSLNRSQIKYAINPRVLDDEVARI